MKTLEFLGRRFGENAPTKLSPTVAWLPEHEELLNKTIMCCRSFDDDGLVECNLYSKLTIEVPDWMTHESYEQVALQYYLGAGANIDWPACAYHRLNGISFAKRYAVCKLLNSKPRVEKRRKMKENFEKWLMSESAPDTIERAMFDGILGRWDYADVSNQYTDLAASQAEHHIYWDR